jgi:hypothetical protein
MCEQFFLTHSVIFSPHVPPGNFPGDQIVRIFAYWAILLFGQFLNCIRSINSWAAFFHGESNELGNVGKIVDFFTD